MGHYIWRFFHKDSQVKGFTGRVGAEGLGTLSVLS